MIVQISGSIEKVSEVHPELSVDVEPFSNYFLSWQQLRKIKEID